MLANPAFVPASSGSGGIPRESAKRRDESNIANTYRPGCGEYSPEFLTCSLISTGNRTVAAQFVGGGVLLPTHLSQPGTNATEPNTNEPLFQVLENFSGGSVPDLIWPARREKQRSFARSMSLDKVFCIMLAVTESMQERWSGFVIPQ